MNNRIAAIGCLSAALAVILGAFGAHALKNHLGAYELGVFETGSKYHFYHSIALVLYGMKGQNRSTSILFILGIVIFCGSLYLLAIFGIKKLGMVTPIGGVLFIVAWIRFAIELIKDKKHAAS